MLLPIKRPDVPSEKGVPEMVIGGLPRVRVVSEIAMAVGLAVKVWEPRTKVVDEGVGFGRGMVLLPMMRPEEPKLMAVPEIVMGGPPAWRVVPAMATPVGLAVKVWPLRVKVVEGPNVGSGTVELPTTSPAEPRLIPVPEMVIRAPPACKIVPATATPVGLAVKVWPPTTKVAEGAFALGIVAVELPTMMFEGPTEIIVPEIVIAGPPTGTVLPDMITPPGTAVKVWPATVKAEELGVSVGMAIVDVPTMRPELPSTKGVPDMVIAGPPGDRVLPAMTTPPGTAVKVCPATVKAEELGFGAGRAIVDVPTTRPELPNTTGVPVMVKAGPPGESVLPEMTTPLGTAVKVCPATVKAEEPKPGEGRAIVDVPTTRPESPSETVAPGIVTADAPELIVWPAPSTAPADEVII